MGSGFSTCNGPATVAVRSSIARHEHEGLGLSDSHDSGISEVGRTRADIDPRDVERHFFDSKQDGPGTPRGLYGPVVPSKPEAPPPELGSNYRLQLKRNPRSAPSLSEFAIREEDEESTPTRTRASRPKSANVRKRRGLKSAKRRPVIEKSRRTESPGGFSSDSTYSDIDSDDSNIISIPDETNSFQGPGLGDDWWKIDPLSTRDFGSFSVRSTNDVSLAKKASERSISSIILFDTDVPTNSAWCFYTNPDAANMVRKNLQQVEEEMWKQVKVISKDCQGQLEDYLQVVRQYRASLTRLVLEYRQASEPASTWNRDLDEKKLKAHEERFADSLYYRQATLTRQELSSFLAEHLQNIEDQLETDGGSASHIRHAGNDVIVADDFLSSALDDGRWAEGTSSQRLKDAGSFDKVTDALLLTLNRKRIGVKVEDLLPVIQNHFPQNAYQNEESEHLQMAQTLVEKSRRGQVNRGEVEAVVRSHLSPKPPTHPRTAASAKPILPMRDQLSDLASTRSSIRSSRPSTVKTEASASHVQTRLVEMESRQKVRPDSGVVVTSSSGSYSSSEQSRDNDMDTASLDSSWISASLHLLDDILRVRTEQHESVKSLVTAVIRDCETPHMKAHALYRWLAHQKLDYYSNTTHKASSPTGKMKQLAEKKITYASLYQEMIRYAGMKCELVEGVVKHQDYLPGDAVKTPQCRHIWNAVLLDGQYRLVDVAFGAKPFKYFVEHFFLAPPDEFRLSHFPNDPKWLRMSQTITMKDFEDTLKTWPAMFAFNIRPLSMKAVIRTYDGKLSVTVLLQNVAVTPTLQYLGPGPAQDADSLVYHIDQEIRSVDNAETFHLNLPQEGTYYFTLLVHDLEEDADIPALQYRIDYNDELL